MAPASLAVPWTSIGLWSRPDLKALLGDGWRVQRPFASCPPDLDAVVGWGYKRSGRAAHRLAGKWNVPCWRLEDGFLRSVGLGRDDPPLSVVVDDLGMYYDASRPSRLETLIAATLSPEEHTRASALIAQWRAARVSKYNHRPEHAGPWPEPYVLVIDQTLGDAAITHGLADRHSFQRMLEAALAEHPDATVVVKIHPDVWAGRRKGHFARDQLQATPRVRVWTEDVHPVGLIEHARCLYVVTSQVGFEGLLWGRAVRCFGMPFYAGWGLTRDELPAPQRRQPAGLEQLVHAALVRYSRYLDPETGARCEPERLLDWMGLQRRARARLPRVIHAVGFSAWKRPIVRSFFQGSEVSFSDEFGADNSGRQTAAVWGRREVPGDVSTVLRVEDGFIRSVGLGADLVRPLSWVIDGRGIYYDATAPSDLEHLLQHAEFDQALLERASRLAGRIVDKALTKYNVGTTGWRRPAGASTVVLVPGQVESDASIQFGSAAVKRNIDLLRAVRESRPGCWVVYKPHPDVVAGLRSQGESEAGALHHCDEVIIDASMGELLAQVDEVHVMTSLAGFEALLRGKTVVTYGQPFYAGWGLTTDMFPPPRRHRKLTLPMLVAATLVLYPSYVSRSSGRFCTPERALDELLAWRDSVPARPGWARRALRLLLGLRRR